MDIKDVLKQKFIDYIQSNNIEDSVFRDLPKEASLTFFNDDFLFDIFLKTFLQEDDDVVVSVIGEELFNSNTFRQLKVSLLEDYAFFN